jgi:hypothetical protein
VARARREESEDLSWGGGPGTGEARRGEAEGMVELWTGRVGSGVRSGCCSCFDPWRSWSAPVGPTPPLQAKLSFPIFKVIF